MKTVVNLAHRGASAYAPENTLASFYKAVDLGADGIETDLRRTKDGVIILFHDGDLRDKTGVPGKPSDYTWAELQNMDAGAWFSPQYKGERLVSLEELIYSFGRKDLIFALELKEPGLEEEVLGLLNRYGIKDKVTITSFIFEALAAVRNSDSKIDLGYLTQTIDSAAIAEVRSIQARQICPNAKKLQRQDVLSAKEYCLEVRAWKVVDETTMRHAVCCGVDGMTVDFPDILNEYTCSR